ncbi:tetratricopeptide repeat protein [uncultured Marivita sp.]|uniref:tetratricopeptide repeat protein n=1 Tax=uncultured Marivita sp. TaxID=888080 RepID=UPI0026155259|nr:tetratricopeptide repeat protein [uncultured Marivita sp.]
MLLLSSALVLSACESAEERAEEHYQNAIALIAEGDVDRAMVELRNVFELNSSHVGARRAMADLQLERGNRQGAYRQYLRLAEADPDDFESRIILSEIAFITGSWEELDRHSIRAEELAPDDPRVEIVALVRDYWTAIRDDEPAERRSLGSQAETLVEDHPESLLLRSVLMDNAIREQQFSRALDEIDRIIELEPANSRYYQERLRILAMLGDISGVEAQLREMIEVFPEDPAHKATLIRFYVSRNNLDAAEAVLRDLSNNAADDDPDPTVDLIRFLATFRDAEAVKAEIEKAISERSDPAPFQVLAASFDFSLGNRSEAIATLQDVLENSEPSEQTRDIKVTLAKMLLATGNEVGARTQVEEVLAEDSSHPDALKMQAAWQIEADDTDAAISGLRIALDQEPRDAEAMTLIASAYARAGQVELARDFLAQAVEASGNAPAETLRYAQLLIGEERYLPAEDILLDALRLAPSNTEILITLGQLYLQMDDLSRTQSVVDTLRRIGEDMAVQAANGLEAERLNRQSGTDAAMSYLEDIANGADATLAEKIALVRARLGTGDTAGALALAQELKQENPDNEALDTVLAVAYIANGDFDAAEERYRDLLSANPVRPRLWLELSRLHLRQGDREAAKSAVDEGLSHSPESADLLWAQASFEEQDGNVDTAIEIYQTLYEQNSNSVVVANNLASLLATYRDDTDSLDRAWTVARRFSDANVPALNDTYGWILHRRGNSAEALPYLEAAAQGLPGDPIVQYHLGQVYNALDRSQDALDQFRKAIDVAGPADTRPQLEEARELVRTLQETGSTED